MDPLPPGHACLLTGASRGAVATIGIVAESLGQRLSPLISLARDAPIQPGQVRYAQWHGRVAAIQPPMAAESVVISRLSDRAAPEGGEAWEVHCHGGQAAAARLLDDLRQLGITTLSQPRWLRQFGDAPTGREVRDGMDQRDGESILHHEAVEVLIRTQTARTAAIALDQFRAGLPKLVAELRRSLALGTAILDESRWISIRQQIARILRFAELGKHLAEPWRVVLAGPPNAGKSSLINALLGYRRSITMDEPGTTRDVLEARTVMDGWPIRFSDTAGIRSQATSAVEFAGIAAARRELEQADLVLWVVMAPTRAIAAPTATFLTDRELVGTEPCEDAGQPGQPAAGLPPRHIRVLSQVDRLPSEALDDLGDWLGTSAVTGQGLDQLRQRIVTSLVPEVPAAGEPVPLNERQIRWLERIFQAEDETSLRAAIERLENDRD